jgi:uncharacterized membrane protein YfcA
MISDMVLYPLSGFAVGLVVGLTGVGGGSLMTPLLVLLFGIKAKTAVGTDLLYAAATKAFGTAIHSAGKTVDWRIVRRLAAGSIPATLATIGALHLATSHGQDASNFISKILGIALMVSAAATLFRGAIVRALGRHVGELSPGTVSTLTIISGAVLGVLVSLSSVGAGALGMIVLLVLYPRSSTATLVGSDIAHAVPLTLIAGSGYWLSGGVDDGLLVKLLMGSIPGIAIGSWLGPKMPEFGLRTILAVVLMAVGARLVHLY